MPELNFRDQFRSSYCHSVQNSSIGGDCNYLPGNKLSAGQQSTLGSIFNPTAARYLHTYNGNAVDVVICNDLSQFLGIIHFIQLWTADQRNFAPDELVMKITVGISGTISGD